MGKRRWIGWLLGGSLVLVALLCGGTLALGWRGQQAAVPAVGGGAARGVAGYEAEIEALPAEALPPAAAKGPMDMPVAAASDVERVASDLPKTRLVIKNADLAVVVDDPRTAQDQVIAWVESQGGFVISSSFSERTLPSGKRVVYGELHFRVPAERFLDAIEAVKSLAVRVEREDISGQDVTDEYVDLEARLRNLQAAEEELRRLLDEATNTNEVLNIYRELMRVREEIERLQGRMRYLQESVAYSAVRVEFIPVEADEPVSIGGWEPKGVARDALRALIRTGQALVNALIWVGIYWLPVLAVVGLLVWGVWRMGRGLWRWLTRPRSGPGSPDRGSPA